MTTLSVDERAWVEGGVPERAIQLRKAAISCIDQGRYEVAIYMLEQAWRIIAEELFRVLQQREDNDGKV